MSDNFRLSKKQIAVTSQAISKTRLTLSICTKTIVFNTKRLNLREGCASKPNPNHTNESDQKSQDKEKYTKCGHTDRTLNKEYYLEVKRRLRKTI